jgi:hypothetical protein
MTQSIDIASFVNGTAAFQFAGLPPGTDTINIDVYDVNGTKLYTATGSATIVAGQVTQVNIACTAATGKLQINFNCASCLDPSLPTPAPSWMPNPTPSCSCSPSSTPTPTPVPTQTPCTPGSSSPGTNSPLAPTLAFVNADQDDFVALNNYGADGQLDGHFTVTFNFAQPTTVENLLLSSGSGLWQSSNAGWAILGVYQNGVPVTSGYENTLGTFQGTVTFDVYGTNLDDAYFKSCDQATVTAQINNGAYTSNSISLP